METGATSPSLWPRSPSQPLLRRHSHRDSSPESRAQAIARGQWELMEMVKRMPESSYELTLKDLVENHNTSLQNDETAVVKVKREKNVVESGSFQNKGLFLNMMFPFSLKSKKEKKNFGERDWWKKGFTGSSDGDSSRTSNNSAATTATTTTAGGGGSSRSNSGSRYVIYRRSDFYQNWESFSVKFRAKTEK